MRLSWYKATSLVAPAATPPSRHPKRRAPNARPSLTMPLEDRSSPDHDAGRVVESCCRPSGIVEAHSYENVGQRLQGSSGSEKPRELRVVAYVEFCLRPRQWSGSSCRSRAGHRRRWRDRAVCGIARCRKRLTVRRWGWSPRCRRQPRR